MDCRFPRMGPGRHQGRGFPGFFPRKHAPEDRWGRSLQLRQCAASGFVAALRVNQFLQQFCGQVWPI